MKAIFSVRSCLVSSAFLASSFLLFACGEGGGEQGGSSLDLGFNSKAPESVSLNLNGLMNFNGKSSEELFALRAKNVSAYPTLLQGAYQPSKTVFEIESKNPWWGIKGYLFKGRGISETDGLSRESAYFGNPLLLVCPEWYGTDMHWSGQRFPKADDFASSFPTYLPPAKATIYPKEKREEIRYDVMPYFNHVASMQNGPWKISSIGFDLRAYNARDFGFNYIYVDPNESKNISKLPPEVVAIGQQLTTRTRDTCAPACNDLITPDVLCGFKLKDLPAKCRLLLWKNKPASHLVANDMKVDLIFQ